MSAISSCAGNACRDASALSSDYFNVIHKGSKLATLHLCLRGNLAAQAVDPLLSVVPPYTCQCPIPQRSSQPYRDQPLATCCRISHLRCLPTWPPRRCFHTAPHSRACVSQIKLICISSCLLCSSLSAWSGDQEQDNAIDRCRRRIHRNVQPCVGPRHLRHQQPWRRSANIRGPPRLLRNEVC